MDLPFKITMISGDLRRELHPYNINNRVGPNNTIDWKHIPHFKEYYPLKLRFTANNKSGYIMYSSDLDNYNIQRPSYHKFNHKSHVKGFEYIYTPSSDPYIIYSHDESIQGQPLSADLYILYITNGNHFYYCYFAIVPKELSFTEWGHMINDLNNVSQQLALDYKNQRFGLINNTHNQINEIFAHNLVNMSNDVIMSLHIILKYIHYKSSKRYSWVKLGKEKGIDGITIKEMNKSSIKNNYIYAPFHFINYNIDDNRWIKYITKRLFYWTIDSINVCQKVKKHNNDTKHHNYIKYNNMDVNESIKTLRNLKYYLIYNLTQSTLSNVDSKIPNHISKGLIISPKYNKYYKLYKQVRKAKGHIKFQITPNRPNYQKTDKLYEYWTLIKTYQSIKAIGYHKIKEYIPNYGLSQYLWPLVPNTRFLMKNSNNNIYLRLVYDDQITKSNSSSKKLCYREPLYQFGSHNRPDIRIDIFSNKKFLGDIILDAKYKKLNTIVQNGNVNTVRDQLLGYSRGFDIRKTNHPINIPVMVLYPSNNKKITNSIISQENSFNSMNIFMEHLRPLHNKDIINLEESLKLKIDKIVSN